MSFSTTGMKKILIIDDDKTFQKVMSDKLTLLTYEVVQAFDGEEGLNKAISENPDLILLDVKMPKKDGITLLRELRSNTNIPKVPVLITSNLSGTDNIAEGVALGVKGYIIKSNETLDTLVREVEAVLTPEKTIKSEIRKVG